MKPITIETEESSTTYDTALEAMDGENIFSIVKQDDGTFELNGTEDYCDRCTLTRDQLIQLADEIRALAGKPENSTQTTEQHYRPKKFCKIANISLATFWRRVRDGQIKVKRPSPRVTLVSASELNSFLKSKN